MSLVASAHPTTRATARLSPPSLGVISAATSEMRRPGRCTHARTRTALTGMTPRMSRVSRAIRIGEPASRSSIALVNSASGGEPCWISGSQLLRVASVAANS